MTPPKLPCFHPGCEEPAPWGYFDPSRKPEPGKPHAMVWACTEHRDEAEARRDELLEQVRRTG